MRLFPSHLVVPDGKRVGVGIAEEDCAGVEVERDIAAHPEGSGDIFTGGDEDGSAAALAAEIDCLLDGGGRKRRRQRTAPVSSTLSQACGSLCR